MAVERYPERPKPAVLSETSITIQISKIVTILENLLMRLQETSTIILQKSQIPITGGIYVLQAYQTRHRIQELILVTVVLQQLLLK